MADHTHQTAPTQFVDGAGIRFAYRRFGKNEGVPLVFFQHFTVPISRTICGACQSVLGGTVDWEVTRDLDWLTHP